MIVAVIPARGGSKRLPGKNLRPLAGKPLIAYSIAVCRLVPSIGGCFVTTDDPEIAAVARAHGAEVIDRPSDLAADESPTATAVAHAARHIAALGHDLSAVVTLQPTNPLRPPALLSRAIDEFEARDCSSLVSVSPTAAKTGRIEDGWFVPDYVLGDRSQDVPPRYRENGMIYLTRSELLWNHGDLFGESVLPFVIDTPFDGIDIDVEGDFAVAEEVYLRYADELGY